VEDARRVAAQLDIPHYVFNFSDGFDDQVVQPYVRAYEAGGDAESVRRNATAR
jgi:tRNA-specific 2-thiouridylase